MADDDRQGQWSGERWVIEELDDDYVDVAIATADAPWLFTSLADAERRMDHEASRADARGILGRMERDGLQDAWTDELAYRLPSESVARWFGNRVAIDGLFGSGDHIAPGMVFLVVIDASASEGPAMTFPRLGESGSLEQFGPTWAAHPMSLEPGEDRFWRYILDMYAVNSRVFDLTEFAHAAMAELYEEALRSANGRAPRG